MKLHAQPFRRGFYCDDESLMHPHKPDTVPTWVVSFIGIALPVVLIIVIEGVHLSVFKRGCTNAIHNKPYIKTLYRTISAFLFGCAVTQLTTDIAKYSIGRLRPHYITLCKPKVEVIANCSSLTGYIEADVCTSTNTDDLIEARLSFPSGHTSFAFYCMLYLVVYLQLKFRWRKCWLVRPLIQLGIFVMAYYTALSRISDYMHHWSDVLGGAVLGAVVCFFVIYLITDLPKVYMKASTFVTNAELPLYQSTRNEDHTSDQSSSSSVISNNGLMPIRGQKNNSPP